MKKSKRILIIFVLLCISSIAFMIFAKVKASIDIPPITIEINEEVLKKCNFEVLDVRFEPIHRGKNIVHVQVRNNSKDDQTFAIQVQSYTRRVGWGRNHGRIIKANTTSWGRFPFVFRKSIKNATVLLKCYGPPHDSGSDTWFKKIIYNCNELPHRNITAEELNHVSDDKAGNVIQVFKKFQSLIGDRAFDEAWKLCTNDYIIGAAIDTPNYRRFGPGTLYWKMENLVQLQPESVSTAGTHLYLKATYKRLVWLIDFVQVDNQWKIDWIDHKYNEYENSPPDTFDSKRELAKPPSESQIKAVTNTFQQLQSYAKNENYQMAWECLSRHLQCDPYEDDFEKFEKMATTTTDFDILRLLYDQQPESVTKDGEFLILNARDRWGKIWKWFFIKEDGRWKLYGDVKRPDRGNWKERVLPAMHKRSTEHFDIYYFKDSTAEKELEQIVKDKEEGYEKLCHMLGEDFDLRIEMIYFEDAVTKYTATLHQGVGWAVGTTNVEIYNGKEKCDPYHETVHTLMGRTGSPPAMFNEGFATYMQKEHWKGQPVDKTAADLLRNGNLTPLNMLIARMSIGSLSSDGQVAYPESASFVKFLIDRYGKDRFLQAYRKLRNSDDKYVREHNLETLEQIYGRSLTSLEKEWKAILGGSSLNTGVTEPEYWMPTDPPKVLYKIDCSIDTEEGLLKGQEIIRFTNTTSQPVRTLALMGSVHGNEGLEIVGNGKSVTLLTNVYDNPIVFSLAKAVGPTESVILDVKFNLSVPVLQKSTEMAAIVNWCPRVWYGFDTHGDYDVRLNVPDEYTVITSGLPDSKSGYYHAEGTKSFGMIITKTHDVLEERAGDVLVRCLYRQRAKECAELLLATAVDAVTFYRERFGFYPYQVLTIVPGSDRPVGGYPMATGIVAIHGMERMDEKPEIHWQWIIAHEIGHQYWGEYVLEKDKPGWLWIGLGIYADREYCRARSLGLQKHKEVMDRYIQGVRNGFDTTMNISLEKLSRIKYDYNNVVIHGKGFSVVSALDCFLGKEVFDKIYRRCMKDFGGRRLGVHEFRTVCEEETGRDLGWFFDQWVNSNRYLSYNIVSEECERQGDSYISRIKVECLGDLKMPVPVVAYFEDGTSKRRLTDRLADISEISFESRSQLKDAQLDPRGALALVVPPPSVSYQRLKKEVRNLPWVGAGGQAITVFKWMKKSELSDSGSWFKLGLTLYDGKYYEEALEAFRLVEELEQQNSSRAFASVVWQGHLHDLFGRRREALQCYKKALPMASDHEMRHDQYGIKVNRQWVQKRLEEPFHRN